MLTDAGEHVSSSSGPTERDVVHLLVMSDKLRLDMTRHEGDTAQNVARLHTDHHRPSQDPTRGGHGPERGPSTHRPSQTITGPDTRGTRPRTWPVYTQIITDHHRTRHEGDAAQNVARLHTDHPDHQHTDHRPSQPVYTLVHIDYKK